MRIGSFLILLLLTSYGIIGFSQTVDMSFHNSFLNGRLTIINDSLNQDVVDINDVDSLNYMEVIDSVLQSKIEMGFLGASIDSIRMGDDKIDIYLYMGYKYDEYNLIYRNGFNSSIDTLRGKTYDDITFSYNELLLSYENMGYPLTKLYPQINVIDSNVIFLDVSIDTVSRIYFDTIVVKGKTSLSYDFISKYLDIRKGDIYNKLKIQEIFLKIKNLDYIKMDQVPILVFYNDKVKLVLDLIQEKNNVFDFIIGIAPETKNGSQKWGISGDITLSLFNKLGYGEHVFFNYKKYASASQLLDFKFSIPYILSTPFGISSSFHILKENDKYLTIKGDNGIKYGDRNLSYYLEWSFFNSRLLNISKSDSLAMLNLGKLPKELDFVFNGVRLGMIRSSLDHRTNPRKGYFLQADLGLGFKRTIKNNEILNISDDRIDFRNSYDTIDLHKIQYEFKGRIEKFFPVWRKSTFLIGLNMAGKYDGGKLFKNEQYKLGGSKHLRGFDENQLFVGVYSLFNLEYRLLLSQNSHLSFPFIDIAFAKDNLFSSPTDIYYGIGGGLSFETKVGLFNFSLAVGKGPSLPIDLRRPKIHFGYLNIF